MRRRRNNDKSLARTRLFSSPATSNGNPPDILVGTPVVTSQFKYELSDLVTMLERSGILTRVELSLFDASVKLHMTDEDDFDNYDVTNGNIKEVPPR